MLLANSKSPIKGLPRTAGHGYKEPYTRDLMLCSLGICKTDNGVLLSALEKTLKTLAKNQSPKGHIPSLVHDPLEKDASDTTPLFLLALSEFRKKTKEKYFLKKAAEKALLWLSYQSPDDDVLIGKLPTSDWRDEEWVLGYGLYVNVIYYEVLKRYKMVKEVRKLKSLVERFEIVGGSKHRRIHEELTTKYKPYFAQWVYKIMASEGFDLVGNSLAMLFGLAPKTRSKKIVKWVEEECKNLRLKGELKGNLPPVLLPYIRPKDPDWHERYEICNKPGCYHSGGVWPFATGLYIAAMAKIGYRKLAREKIVNLTALNKISKNPKYEWGFSEWLKAPDLSPQGSSHQSWSAAIYIYALSFLRGKDLW